MAYTNAWSKLIPLGSADPGLIDDQIRQLRLDIEERMNDVVTDWTVDPVVLGTGTLGVQTGVKIYFHNSILQQRIDDDDISFEGSGAGEYYESDNESGKGAFGHIALPVGCTLTGFEATVDCQPGGFIQMHLRFLTHATGATSLVSTINQSTSGIRAVGTGVISEIIATGRAYYVHFNNANSVRMRIYSMEATIDVAGLSEYIG